MEFAEDAGGTPLSGAQFAARPTRWGGTVPRPEAAS